MRFLFATAALTTLTGCPVAMEYDSAGAYPQEVVECDHPDSAYEAVVHVSVTDPTHYEAIDFRIRQGGLEWETTLWEPNEERPTWETRMQLYELDCREDFTYDFDYTHFDG